MFSRKVNSNYNVYPLRLDSVSYSEIAVSGVYSNLLIDSFLSKSLSDNDLCYIDKFIFLISSIYLSNISDKRHESFADFVPLSAKKMKAVLGRNYIKIKNFLIEKGVIEVNPKFWFSQNKEIKGECRGYRISEKFLKAKFYLRKATFRFRWEKRPEDDSNTIKNLKKELFLVDIDELQALEKVRELQNKKEINPAGAKKAIESIGFIKDKNNYCVPDKKTGRLFHPISNLKRELRQFLAYKGEKLHEIDVVSCQIGLLYALYPKKCAESEKFKLLVESGEFYSRISDGKDIKLDCLRYLFGWSVYWKTKYIDNFFKKEFPILRQLIRCCKSGEGKEDYKKMAFLLQSLEANIMIKKILPICQSKNIPAIPIHDAILTTSENIQFIKELIQTTFLTMFGLTPKIKVKARS